MNTNDSHNLDRPQGLSSHKEKQSPHK
jgi:hypothetical protein